MYDPCRDKKALYEEFCVDEQGVARKTKRSFLRTLRIVAKTSLPFVGVLTVVSAVFFLRELRLQMAVVVLGLLLVEGGIWQLAQTMLPSERKCHFLRAEVDRFLGLVRQLNATACELKTTPAAEKQLEFEGIRNAMREAVDRMADVASKTDTEIAEDLANAASQDLPEGFESRYRS